MNGPSVSRFWGHGLTRSETAELTLPTSSKRQAVVDDCSLRRAVVAIQDHSMSLGSFCRRGRRALSSSFVDNSSVAPNVPFHGFFGW